MSTLLSSHNFFLHLLNLYSNSLMTHGFASELDMLLKLVTLEPSQHTGVLLPFKSSFPEAKGKTKLKIALVIATLFFCLR